MNYTYTRRGLMDKVKFNGKEIADYDYNANGAVSSTDYGLGTIESELNYDNRQRLTSITAQKDGDGKKLFAQTYEYDNLGNRTKLTGTYGGEIGYQYDDLDRLQVVDYPGNKRKLFNYDKEGNREKLVYQHGSGTDNNYKYSYDYNQNNNQLNYYTLSDYTKYDYSYNNNGSVTSKKLKRGGETLRETTYKYDLKDQLRQMTVDGHQINFKYNEKGWRIKKDNGIRTTYYLYGKGQQVLEERNGTNQLKKSFIYGPNGKIATVGDKGNIKYVINDQLGSSSVITNEKGEELARYKYSPFGNLIKSKGETEEIYRFTGKEFDKLTGLYYYGARYYDPTIGRFIGEDPVKDGWNWFVYCSNNPVRYIDSVGLKGKELDYSLSYSQIQSLERTEMGYEMYSYTYQFGEIGFGGDTGVLTNNWFVTPTVTGYASKMFITANTKSYQKYNYITVDEHFKIKTNTEVLALRKVNLYTTMSLGDHVTSEALYQSKIIGRDKVGPYDSSYLTPQLDATSLDEVSFKVPKSSNISRIEMQIDILLLDGIYGHRKGSYNIYPPF